MPFRTSGLRKVRNKKAIIMRLWGGAFG